MIGIMWMLLLTFACIKPGNCDKIRNGNFYYYTKNAREKVLIRRTGSVQSELDGKTGKLLSKSKVVLKEDCKYDMFINSLSDIGLSGDEEIIAKTPAHIEIVDIKDSFYVCIARLDIFDKKFVLKDTIYFDK